MNIDDYGQGLIGPHPKDSDPKRYQLLGILEVAGAATAEFDFTKPIGLPVPPDEDQGSSLSCTWQAFAYYFWQWTGIQLSRQDGYSRTKLPEGGGWLIDPFRAMMENAKGKPTDGTGAYNRKQHQDPNPQTEQNMIIKVNLPGQVRKTFKIRYWYVPYNDINAVAAAIKNWKGCVFGVYYNKNMWQNGEHPDVVTPSQAITAHAIYGMDVGRDRGQDAIIAKSSWCGWVKRHFIIKDYFTKSGVFSPIVMEVREISDMDEVLFINLHGRYGFLSINDGRILGGGLAATPDELRLLQKMANYPKDVINPDGSFIPADITYGI